MPALRLRDSGATNSILFLHSFIVGLLDSCHNYWAPDGPIRPMKYFSQIFAPTNNRRLNELIGFVLCISGLLLFLALASYSPLDPSFNSASVLTGSQSARNWVGLVGAIVSDLLLQGLGIGAFLVPVFLGALGSRWFRSRKVTSPVAKSLGAIWLLVFVPALLALMPGHVRWMGVIPMEGPGRTHRRRCPHPLLESGRRIYCVRHDFGGRAISHDSLLFRFPASLGADPFRLRSRALEPLQRLAGQSGEEEDAEGAGKAARYSADDHSSVDSGASPCGSSAVVCA